MFLLTVSSHFITTVWDYSLTVNEFSCVSSILTVIFICLYIFYSIGSITTVVSNSFIKDWIIESMLNWVFSVIILPLILMSLFLSA